MWYLVFPTRRPSAGAARALWAAAGTALFAALTVQPAAAASFEYTFTLTFESERVNTDWVLPPEVDHHVTDHPDVPEKIEPGWVDPAWLGVDLGRMQFGLERGESATGSFSFHETDGSYDLTVGGNSVFFTDLWRNGIDPDSGDASFMATSGWNNTVLNFITDDGYFMDDSVGTVGSDRHVESHPRYGDFWFDYDYQYHGYTSYFTFSDVERLSPSPREGGPAPRSMFAATTPPVPYGTATFPEPTTMPVPAAPLLLLTGLGALALLRRRA